MKNISEQACKALFTIFLTEQFFDKKLFVNKILGAKKLFEKRTTFGKRAFFDDPDICCELLSSCFKNKQDVEALLQRIQRVMHESLSAEEKVKRVIQECILTDRFSGEPAMIPPVRVIYAQHIKTIDDVAGPLYNLIVLDKTTFFSLF